MCTDSLSLQLNWSVIYIPTNQKITYGLHSLFYTSSILPTQKKGGMGFRVIFQSEKMFHRRQNLKSTGIKNMVLFSFARFGSSNYSCISMV